MKPPLARKPVAIAMVQETKLNIGHVVVIANDGTMWHGQVLDGEIGACWDEMIDLPQPEEVSPF